MTTSASNCSPLRKGEIVGYGSAGGCSGGTTGEFKINLTDTLFKIPRSVRWSPKGYGQRITNYKKSNDGQIVSANCGGSCGFCNPSSGGTYLPLDLTGSYQHFYAVKILCS